MLSSPADAGLPDPLFSVPPSAVPAAPPCAVTVETEITVPVGPVTVVVVEPSAPVSVEVLLLPALADPGLAPDVAALGVSAVAEPIAEIPLMIPCLPDWMILRQER